MLLAVLLLVATWYAAFHVGFFKHADQSVFRGFFDLRHRGQLAAITSFIAGLCDPQPYVYFAAIPVFSALVRRRPRLALSIGAMLLGANATSQVLKPLLAEPRSASLLGGGYPVQAASWPSGHATAAMALTLACILVAPSRLRPWVAVLGALFAVAVSYSFLTLGWHYPSDVVGGFLVALTWTLLVLAARFTAEARRQPVGSADAAQKDSLSEAFAPALGAMFGALLIAGLVVLVRPHAVSSYARAHGAFIIGASAIGACAIAIATGIMLVVRR